MSIKRNGSELIELFAIKAGISNSEAKSFIQALSETVTEVAISEGKATITGFGRFNISEVADREGTQPGTGESIIIPAHKRMNFTPYKKLAEMVNQENEHKKAAVLHSEIEMGAQSAAKNNEKTDTHTSVERMITPVPTEQHRVTKNEMEKTNNSFAALLDEIESQTKAQTQAKTKKPVEFKPPEHPITSTNNPELETNLSEDAQKSALLDELEQLIQQKKREMMGGSLDIRIEEEEEEVTDQNETAQRKLVQKEENNKVLPSILTSPERSTSDDRAPLEAPQKIKFSSSNNPEDAVETNKTKTYLPVDEDLLKDLISSMDELNTAIKSINSKSGLVTPSTKNIISFDKNIFIPGSLIGVLLLLVSGFLIGNNTDRLFNQGFMDRFSSVDQQANQINSTTIPQNPSSSVQLAGLTGGTSQNTTNSNSNRPSSTPTESNINSNTPRPSLNSTVSNSNPPTPSVTSTTSSVRFRSTIGLYNMAQEIYGNPRLWVLLFEENFSTSQNPDDIANGTTLSIPKVAAPGSFSELERERLRIALLHVAKAYENAGKQDLAQSYRSASVYYPNTM